MIIYKCNQKKFDKEFICPINKKCYMCSSAIEQKDNQLTLFN